MSWWFLKWFVAFLSWNIFHQSVCFISKWIIFHIFLICVWSFLTSGVIKFSLDTVDCKLLELCLHCICSLNIIIDEHLGLSKMIAAFSRTGKLLCINTSEAIESNFHLSWNTLPLATCVPKFQHLLLIYLQLFYVWHLVNIFYWLYSRHLKQMYEKNAWSKVLSVHSFCEIFYDQDYVLPKIWIFWLRLLILKVQTCCFF